jgi:phage-related protein (TIGR01555 family)
MLDGLRNVVAGLGESQDKSVHSIYSLTLATQQEIDACYRGTWLGRKIHDIPPKDMTREWRAWQADDAQIEAIEAEERRLQIRIKVRRALTYARLYGGSALILGLPGKPDTPANPEGIRKGGLRYVHLAHRHQLTLGEPERDLEADGFGRPSRFELSAGGGQSVPIHPSRVVAFTAQEVPEGSMDGTGQAWFWGDPLLQSIADALKASDTVQQSIAALMHEAKVDVIHMPGFMNNLSDPRYERTVIERLQLAAMMKSMSNALVLDGGDGTEHSGERWETRQLNFDGLPDVQRVFLQLVSGAADIPATRLIGQAPQGMNATGDSDIRNYYDMLASAQSGEMTPTLAPLDEALIRSATGARDEDIHYVWNPLWQMSPTEKATRDKTVAETVNIYAGLAVIPTEAMEMAVQNLLIEHSVLPGLEAALEESDDEIESLEMPEAANDPDDPEELERPRRRAVGGGRGSAVLRAANDRRRRLARDRARALADRSHDEQDGGTGPVAEPPAKP